VHSSLLANFYYVHCRLTCCIGSVVVYAKHTSTPTTLQSRAVAQTQQVMVQCLMCCSDCTITFCQTLALLCLLMNYVLRRSCRLCRHMLVQKVRATALDVLQHGTPGLPGPSSE
jgi:hypothetical protein